MLDETSNQSIGNLTLLLEKAEAIQLIGYLEDLVSEESPNEHFHLNDAEYTKEITIALYEDKRLDGFSDRYKLLITEDK
jgi:hypothetical protein